MVTGAAGRIGRAVIRELEAHGLPWIGVDARAEVAFQPSGDFAMRRVALEDLGSTIEVLRGARGVIHLANHPYPRYEPDQVVFTGNMRINYNLFSAAELLCIPRVVWLSSEKATGMPFQLTSPRALPLDEFHPVSPECAYGLSKRLSEEVAAFHARTARTSFVGLRAALVQDSSNYAGYRDFQNDPHSRRWHLWNYIDIRDLARACRLGVEANLTGAHVMHIAARDTVVDMPTAELVREAFGNIAWYPSSDDVNASLANIRTAEQVIGFRPEITWRDSR